jgi:hypothetical protein
MASSPGEAKTIFTEIIDHAQTATIPAVLNIGGGVFGYLGEGQLSIVFGAVRDGVS